MSWCNSHYSNIKTWKWIVNWPFLNNYSSSKICWMGIMWLWLQIILVWCLQLMQANLTHNHWATFTHPETEQMTEQRTHGFLLSTLYTFMRTAADSVVCLFWLEMSRRLHFNKEILVQTGYIMVSELWDNTEVRPSKYHTNHAYFSHPTVHFILHLSVVS